MRRFVGSRAGRSGRSGVGARFWHSISAEGVLSRLRERRFVTSHLSESASTRPILPSWFVLLAMLVVAAAVASRKPELVVHPQFWGDEARWFTEGYAHGAWAALHIPQGGYLVVGS